MKSLREIVVDQLRSNLVTIILEALVLIVIATCAILEIRDVKRDLLARLDAAEQALIEYGKGEAVKFQQVSEDVTQMTKALAVLTEQTTNVIVDNQDEIVEAAKDRRSRILDSLFNRDEDKANDP